MADTAARITVDEAAGRLNTSAATVRRMCLSGALRAVKVGRAWLIDSSSLPSQIHRQRRSGAATATADLPLALTQVRGHDLRHDVWVPDVLRFEDDLRDPDRLLDAAARRLDLEEPFDPAVFVPVPKSPIFPRNSVDLSLIDRIAYQAAVGTVAALIHAAQSPSSYSARPSYRTGEFLRNGRDGWLAWRSDVVKSIAQDGPWMIETDITAFFDFIKHELLLPDLTDLGAPTAVTNCLREALRTWSLTPNTGLPQGPNASRLLADFYLISIDHVLARRTDVAYLRFMDDIRIIGPTRASVIAALQELDGECRRRGLALSTKKTELREGTSAINSMQNKELDFLQYTFNVGDESDDELRKQLRRIFQRSIRQDGTVDTRHARFSLSRLYQLRDRHIVRRILLNLEHLGPLRSLVPMYLHPWLHRAPVQKEVTAFLRDRERNHSSFMSTWLMAVMLDVPGPLPSEWTDYARLIACDRSEPTFHRTIAENVMALSHHPRDIVRLEEIIRREFDPEIVRAATVALARIGKLSKATAARAVRIPGLEETTAYLRGIQDLPSLVFASRRVPTAT